MKFCKSFFTRAMATACLATLFCTSCTQKEEPLPPVQEEEKQEQEQSDPSIQFSVKMVRSGNTDLFVAEATLESKDRRDEWWEMQVRYTRIIDNLGTTPLTFVQRGEIFKKNGTASLRIGTFPKGANEVDVTLTDAAGKKASRHITFEN